MWENLTARIARKLLVLKLRKRPPLHAREALQSAEFSADYLETAPSRAGSSGVVIGLRPFRSIDAQRAQEALAVKGGHRGGG
jgi:hypothetical protein